MRAAVVHRSSPPSGPFLADSKDFLATPLAAVAVGARIWRPGIEFFLYYSPTTLHNRSLPAPLAYSLVQSCASPRPFHQGPGPSAPCAAPAGNGASASLDAIPPSAARADAAAIPAAAAAAAMHLPSCGAATSTAAAPPAASSPTL